MFEIGQRPLAPKPGQYQGLASLASACRRFAAEFTTTALWLGFFSDFSERDRPPEANRRLGSTKGGGPVRIAIIGCILGTAVGDALGLPYEGVSPARAVKLLGAPDRHRFFFSRGMISDDTEHTRMVAQSLIDAGGCDTLGPLPTIPIATSFSVACDWSTATRAPYNRTPAAQLSR